MVVEQAWKTFRGNAGILLVFSISFLLGVLMLIIASAPTYNAVGGVFMRFLSMPDMNAVDVIFISVALLLSNYFVAFGVVAVNLIVKKERTMLNLTTEILNNISKYTFTVFMIFIILFIINAIIQLGFAGLQAPYWVSALVFTLIYLPSFYIGPAIVIDELKPFQALMASMDHIKRYPMRLIKWCIAGLAMMFAASYGSYLIAPAYFQWITILINSFLIIPFLIVYQSHNYIEKYGILKRGRKKRR